MTQHLRTASYEVTAMTDPGVLLRILELFALRDLVPQRVKCRTVADRLFAEIDLSGVADREAELIAAKMRAIVQVISVRLQQMELRQAA